MAFLTTGGSSVTSSNIVDGEIVNADISAAAAIAHSKIADGAGANTDLFTVEHTVGQTHSLTTLANQRVVVIVTGDAVTAGAEQAIDIQYNGVTKATVNHDIAAGSKAGFATSYTEVPGAATANITISTSATIANVRILVFKFRMS